MRRFKIIGMGPGHENYVLPIAKSSLEKADILIGAIRYLEVYGNENQVLVPLNRNYSEITNMIKQYNQKKDITVLVSGDASFFSLTTYLKKHFSKEEIEIIPGISSVQYMYSRLGISYENAYLTSFHGRECYMPAVEKPFQTLAFLTDNKWTPDKIAQYAIQSQLRYQWMYVGENLSYDNETIKKMTLDEGSTYRTDHINVVVLANE